MDFDLAIVGGGPAGVSTALFLSARAPRWAERIAILEKEPYPREKICAGAIGARADRLLATIGIHVDVPSVSVSAFSAASASHAVAERHDRPIGRVVRRIEFDRALADRARERQITILEGVRVSGLVTDERGVRLGTSQGELRARAVVGADGVGSAVRRAIGAPRGRFYAQVVEVDTLASPGDPSRETLHFDIADRSLAGYAWDFPTLVGGEPLVCRGIYELRDDTSPAERGKDVGARLQERLAHLGVEPAGKIKRFAERGLALHEPLAVPRALLVGEAAGIDPVLGEGIAQAIFYGSCAGDYLARRLETDELSFADWRRAVRRSRVGFDLGVRSRLAPFAYGKHRPALERFVTSSRHWASAGMHYFAGEHVPRKRLALAALDLASAFLKA